MTDQNTPGALSQAELLDLWKSSIDPLYAQPLLEQGEGFGLELHTQAHAQFARVSQAIDVSTQALYIRSWSGETNTSARGETFSTVTLTLQRTGISTSPLTLTAGMFVVQEETTDYGVDGGETVLTGRKYTLVQDVTWAANDVSAKSVPAIATLPGAGFNNPLPGTIKTPYQPGTNFSNSFASIATGNALVVRNSPDVIIPDHVGQYVQLVSGANAGAIRRIIGYTRPNLTASPPSGGTALLDGTPLVLENGTVSWRILDWVSDWGITASNAAKPIGGGLGSLDALGAERNISRSNQESDALYRERISQIADVVTPRAVLRAANRILSAYMTTATLREPGVNLPGIFYDGDPFSTDPAEAFAYDMDGTSRAYADAWKVYLDYKEFRGFFVLELPRLWIGEFGYSYDAGPYAAYDTTAPFAAFFDGQPLGSMALYKQIFDAVNKVRAGGVLFDLVRRAA